MNEKLTNLKLKSCFKTSDSKKRHNKKLFSLISKKYNLATRILSFGQDQKWKSKLIKHLPNIENAVCLDIACGTGDITFMLAEKYKYGTIYGLDITNAMLDEAIKLNNFNNVYFICNDMSQTYLADNSVDIITGGYALRNSSDLKQTLGEIYRVLKPNGIVAILDFNRFTNKYAQKIEYWLLKLWGSICGIILHKNYTTYAYIAESIKYYPTNAELNQIIEEFGFEIVKAKKFFLGTVQILIFKN